jgi:hypothetical protein
MFKFIDAQIELKDDFFQSLDFETYFRYGGSLYKKRLTEVFPSGRSLVMFVLPIFE